MANVLVVDDDKDICELISYALEDDGCHVNRVFEGEVALKQMKTWPYDIMILDYVLPGISGLSVLEQARQISPSIATIMISGFSDDSTKDKAAELGAYDFLEKPIDTARLVKVVNSAIEIQNRLLRNGYGRKGLRPSMNENTRFFQKVEGANPLAPSGSAISQISKSKKGGGEKTWQ